MPDRLHGRPKKVRYIQKMPKILQFSPRGKPGRPDEVELGLDQFEALKLADFQGFSQSQGAIAMHISRASFGRILREARKRVAEAIINGKSLKIRMGDVQVGVRRSDISRDALVGEIKKFQDHARQMAGEIQRISSFGPTSDGKAVVRNGGEEKVLKGAVPGDAEDSFGRVL